jgi:hypothetical protein
LKGEAALQISALVEKPQSMLSPLRIIDMVLIMVVGIPTNTLN